MNDVVVPNELAQQSTDALTAAKGFSVTTSADYETAGLRLKMNKALQAEIEAHFGPHIKRAFDMHRGLVAAKNTALAPLTQAETVYKSKMLGFQNELDRQRREQEAKAREQAEKERKKLEEQARKLEEKGKLEQAEAKREAAALVPTPIVSVQTPKVAGIATRTTYKARVTGLMDLVKAVAAGTVPLQALQADEAFLNQMARAMKTALNYPGVEVEVEQALSSRAS